MIVLEVVRNKVLEVAANFGLEEVQDTLTNDKYMLYQTEQNTQGSIQSIYPFTIEVLSSNIEESETLTYGCGSFVDELLKAGFTVAFSRSRKDDDEGNQLGVTTTIECNTFI